MQQSQLHGVSVLGFWGSEEGLLSFIAACPQEEPLSLMWGRAEGWGGSQFGASVHFIRKCGEVSVLWYLSDSWILFLNYSELGGRGGGVANHSSQTPTRPDTLHTPVLHFALYCTHPCTALYFYSFHWTPDHSGTPLHLQHPALAHQYLVPTSWWTLPPLLYPNPTVALPLGGQVFPYKTLIYALSH